jgi:hypothetical protein
MVAAIQNGPTSCPSYGLSSAHRFFGKAFERPQWPLLAGFACFGRLSARPGWSAFLPRALQHGISLFDPSRISFTSLGNQ